MEFSRENLFRRRCVGLSLAAWVGSVALVGFYLSWSRNDQMYFTYNPDTLGITPRNVTVFLGEKTLIMVMLNISNCVYALSFPVYIVLLIKVTFVRF